MYKYQRTLFLIFLLFSAVSVALARQYTATSALSEGKWVKIKVTQGGVQQLDYDLLRSWGFSNPEEVAVYGFDPTLLYLHNFGSAVPDDLPPVPAIHSHGKIFFYSDGDHYAFSKGSGLDCTTTTVRNNTDSNAYYWLTDQRPGLAPSEVPFSTPSGDISGAVFGLSHIEREVQNPSQGGAHYHGPNLAPGEVENFVLPMPGLDYTRRNVNRDFCLIRYAFAENEGSNTRYYPQLTVEGIDSIGGGHGSWMSGVPSTSVYYRITDYIKCWPTADTIKIDFKVPSNYTGSYYAVDRMMVTYPATLTDIGASWVYQIKYTCNTSKRLAVNDCDENTEIWDITDKGNVRRHVISQLEDGSFITPSKSYTADSPARLVVFNTAAEQITPEYVGEAANQNLHGDSTPHLLIISTASLLPQAEALADIHRSLRGIDVRVVAQEDIFNEFSSGSRHPHAFRLYAKMLYERTPGKLRWILMYGNTNWDQRGLCGPMADWLVGYQTEDYTYSGTKTASFCGDQYFGMLDESYNHSKIEFQKMQVAVGRLPLEHEGAAVAANEKIRRFLEEPIKPWAFQRALFFSDKGDDEVHLEHCTRAVNNLIAPVRTVDRADCTTFGSLGDVYPYIKRSLNRGVGYFSYNGHGNTNALSDIINLNGMVNLENVDWPLAVISSCNTFNFDRGDGGVAGQMLSNPHSGAVGIVASGRQVYLSSNMAVTEGLALQYANARPGTTYGELLMLARNRQIDIWPVAARVDATNFMCYVYGGDPSLPMPVAEYSVSLTQLGNPGGTTVTPLQPVAFRAQVRNGNSQVNKNGTALVEIYSVPETRPFINHEYDQDRNQIQVPDTVFVDANILAEIPVEVNGGVIEGVMVVPEDFRYTPGVKNRMVITAVLEDGTRAAGATEITLAPLAPEGLTPVGDGPAVTRIWLVGCENAQANSPSPTLKAQVAAGTAPLNTSLYVPGSKPMLMIDGQSYTDKLLLSATPEGFEFTVNTDNLADGPHNVSIRVSDIYGRSAEGYYSFHVCTTPLRPVLSIGSPDGPARESVCFNVDSADDNARFTLVVRDHTGRTVYRRENATFPLEWDLCNAAGERIADGLYNANVTVRAESRFGHSESVPLVVIAPLAD